MLLLVHTTQLIVHGDARVTGILTVGTSSITLNGSTDTITATTFDGNATSATTATSGRLLVVQQQQLLLICFNYSSWFILCCWV